MEPSELRHIRESRKQTRADLAADLGCSAGAIVQWEGGTRAIPNWVPEKLLSKVTVTLPLHELGALLNHATATGQPFDAMMTEAILDYLASKSPEKKSARDTMLPITTLAETPAIYGKKKPA